MKKSKYITKSSTGTYKLGKLLALKCRGGEIFAIQGDLGSGKTAFCQGLASGLGVKSIVNSPTFNILKLYKAKLNNIKHFCHIDAYRLSSGDELLNIGFADIINDLEYVTAIEWPNNIKSALKADIKIINIEYIDKDKREITLQF